MVSKQFIEVNLGIYDNSPKIQATNGDVGPSFLDNKYDAELRKRSKERAKKKKKNEKKVTPKNVFKQKEAFKIKDKPFRIKNQVF
ncbi:MAG: hypothetical protein KAS32_30000 [Candidatus Peribacteraceae bacterium]|nr:hypothetical protein [Candidatus Peribacteraceae bacterium]